MSLRTQAKVLRVLEEQRFERVGGTESLEVDVRVLAASNKDLVQAIAEGKFREDLYYRLNVVPLYVPPLRERRGDAGLLANYFLREFCNEYGKKEKVMSAEAMTAVKDYHWPGNVRELKNLIERLIIMVPSDKIELFDVESSLGPSVSVPTGIVTEGSLSEDSLREAVDQFEKAFILERLRENNWNISRTAEKLGIERSNLHRKLKALGVKRAV